MQTLMHCEYCGQYCLWGLEYHTAPCCEECKWIPLMVCVICGLGCLGLLAAAYLLYGVS